MFLRRCIIYSNFRFFFLRVKNVYDSVFQVLKDPKKRQIYDQFGEEGLKGGGMGGAGGADFSQFQQFNFSSFDPFNTFKSFFGDEDPFKGKDLFR